MKLCVFQGTFNPIHKVHLEIAKFAKNYYHFDNILFIPAYIPPHKTLDKNLAKHRFNMVKIAISGHDGFNISDIEYKHEKFSYTYYTILELRKKHNIEAEKIDFIIGTDAFLKIKSWYESDKLKGLVRFIVFPRTDEFKMSDFDGLKADGYDFEFAPMKYIDVSSTELRNNIKTGTSIKNMALPKVREYIEENGLYISK